MYLPHQIKTSEIVAQRLNDLGLCYVFGEPRSGKTRTAIRTAELIGAKNVLVLTPKAAIKGWDKELAAVGYTGNITVTNYEQAKKLTGSYDLVVVDEAHRLGKVGKPTQRIKDIRPIAYNAKCLYLSGTPIVETPLAIYHQFIICKNTPFKHKNFYAFFREWGIPAPIRLHGRLVEQYKKSRPELLDQIEPYIVRMTQRDAGIPNSVQAQDRVHCVPLQQSTHDLIAEIVEKQVATIAGEMVGFESDMQERVAVHQIETGAVKIDEDYYLLDNREVVEYILKEFGDSKDVALMCHFKATRLKLERYFKRASIYSSVAHAEGVDLSHYKHFVIVNADYSGAKFVQRRERLVNVRKETESIVHHITTDGGISAAVYKAVSAKKDFNIRCYRDERTSITEEDH